jgi:hypothetical protein
MRQIGATGQVVSCPDMSVLLTYLVETVNSRIRSNDARNAAIRP